MKNRVKITVDGKSFMLVGEESAAHLHEVGEYIDAKMKEVRGNALAVTLDASLAYVLTSLNVADDYFKARERCAELEEQVSGLTTRLEKAEKAEKTKTVEIESVSKNDNYLEGRIEALERELQESKRAREIAENKLDEYLLAAEQVPTYTNTRYPQKKNRR